MGKNKIPVWENYSDYRGDLEFLIEGLLPLSDKNYQIRIWAEAKGPEMAWYDESMLTFDTKIEYLKYAIRKGIVKLTPHEIKAVLRVHAMCNCFIHICDWKSVPKGWSEEQLFIVNHPYFEKIRQQAAYALSLFRLK